MRVLCYRIAAKHVQTMGAVTADAHTVRPERFQTQPRIVK